MSDTRKKHWESSYLRKENFIYYPKEEVVKFINKFIKKRIGTNEFVQLLPATQKLRGLDFGCGIGRITILLHEFGIEGYGIDISENAIKEALELARFLGFHLDNFFKVYDGLKIPFDDDFFDFTIAESVLDSMPFDLAKILIKEIERVTKRYLFLSLMSAESIRMFKDHQGIDFFDGEIEVTEVHERGTIQSFFSFAKIMNLIKDTNFKIKYGEKILYADIFCETNILHGRYYIVLEKGDSQ